MKSLFKYLILFLITSNAFALNFQYDQNNQVLGKVFTVTPKHMDTFSLYARNYDVAAHSIQLANPGIEENYPDKQSKDITIPAAFVLPTRQEGIVVNLPELRLYYFTPGEVYTFPVSVGREGWKTPVRETSVVQKEKDPYWIVPDSILAEAEAKGHPIPAVTPPGPHNPLGEYALHLGIPGYLIHGTNYAPSIGRRVSHGCIRMFPTDIKELFNMVPVGTKVAIINEPIKAGWKNNELYLQAYPLLHEYPLSAADRDALAKDTINQAINGKNVQINWQAVDAIIQRSSGIPGVIGK